VCDPSEDTSFGYTVNGVVVSDFYTPNFFDPVTAAGVRYSYSGAIKKPRQVLEGGYISWWDPISKHMFQLFVESGKTKIEDRGSVPEGFGTMRSFADSFTNKVRAKLDMKPPKGAMLASRPGTKKKAKPTMVDQSTKAHADSLRKQIEAVLKRGK